MSATGANPAGGPVEALRRWEIAGGTWRVVSRGSSGITVSLRRCDGGEEADRFTSADPDLAAYIHGHPEPD